MTKHTLLPLIFLLFTSCSPKGSGGSTTSPVPSENTTAPSTPSPTTPAPTPAPVPVPTPAPPAPEAPSTQKKLWGVTLDSITNLTDIIDSLKSLNVRPTARIVFDENVAASYYKSATAQISIVSDVMGELLDSFYMKSYSLTAYKQRTNEYLNALQDTVDIWEIGNEINGEWLGDASSVAAKMSAAYDIVKQNKKVAALTLYYNENCWKYPSEEMFTWAQANVPTRMKQGLDYVFVSYYEDDCNGQQPNWPAVFDKLGKMFPNSKIGFGEVGTSIASRKASYLTRYYNLEISHPRFIGGYFWWYFKQDMVPKTKPLWNTLNDILP